MRDNVLAEARLDRTAFSVVLIEEADQLDEDFWKTRTPDERFEALELSRQIAYGYDPTARGLSRFFEVAPFPPDCNAIPGE